jgi:hypothetical protein
VEGKDRGKISKRDHQEVEKQTSDLGDCRIDSGAPVAELGEDRRMIA